MTRPVRALPLVALALVACTGSSNSNKDAGPKGSDTGLSGACDPIVPGTDDRPLCGFPFPSSVYEAPDSSKPTGRKIVFKADTLPDVSGTPTDPAAWYDSDGFSPGQGPITVIEGATASGLPRQNNVAASLDMANSPTILLEDTSENDTSVAPTPVPHFAEVDVNGEASDTAYDRVLMIRPLVRLKDNTRYIVAIRNVKDASGAVVPPTAAFAGIVSGADSQGRANLYANIFAKLEKVGVHKDNLQIAWDYHTASKENNTTQLVKMRDLALAALPSTGPTFTITATTSPTKPIAGETHATDDKYIGRRIFGKLHIPLFLDSATVVAGTGDTTTGYTLQRESDGTPKMNGFGDFDFIVEVPWSVLEDTQAAPTLFQGHGLFSDRAEGQNSNSDSYSYLNKLAFDHKYVTITTDMLGWRTPETYNGWPADWAATFTDAKDPNQEDDNNKAIGFIGSPAGTFRGMIDRGTQGLLNELIAVKAMESSLGNDPALQAPGDNHKMVDATKSFYRGDSQGGILGVTFMALSQTVSRGYLGEPGFPYNLLLTRSADFTTFLGALQLNYGGNIRTQLVLGLMQMFWDRYEGDGFAPYITSADAAGRLPNTPISHTVLINSAIGDFQVTPIASQILARAVGAKVLKPALQSPLFSGDTAKLPIYGLTEADGPIAGNALQEYDFGVLTSVTVSETNKPPDGDDNFDPHDKIRNLPSAEASTFDFLSTGNAVNHCASDGSVGACVFPPDAP